MAPSTAARMIFAATVTVAKAAPTALGLKSVANAVGFGWVPFFGEELKYGMFIEELDYMDKETRLSEANITEVESFAALWTGGLTFDFRGKVDGPPRSADEARVTNDSLVHDAAAQPDLADKDAVCTSSASLADERRILQDVQAQLARLDVLLLHSGPQRPARQQAPDAAWLGWDASGESSRQLRQISFSFREERRSRTFAVTPVAPSTSMVSSLKQIAAA